MSTRKRRWSIGTIILGSLILLQSVYVYQTHRSAHEISARLHLKILTLMLHQTVIFEELSELQR